MNRRKSLNSMSVASSDTICARKAAKMKLEIAIIYPSWFQSTLLLFPVRPRIGPTASWTDCAFRSCTLMKASPSNLQVRGLNCTGLNRAQCERRLSVQDFHSPQETSPGDVRPLASQRRHGGTSFKTPDGDNLRHQSRSRDDCLCDLGFPLRRHLETLNPDITDYAEVTRGRDNKIAENAYGVLQCLTTEEPKETRSKVAKTTLGKRTDRISIIAAQTLRRKT